MNYRVHFRGEDLGVFPLPELLRQRRAGALTGQELVWCEGMADWQTLDSVLGFSAPAPARQRLNRWLIAGIVAAALLVLGGLAVFVYAARVFIQGATTAAQVALAKQGAVPGTSPGADFAARPIVYGTNSTTQADLSKEEKAFGQRQFADAYDEFGPHNEPWDADARFFIRSWIDSDFGQKGGTNLPALRDLASKLAQNPSCNDPVVLQLAAMASVDYFEAMHRHQRAFDAFANSKYRAYLKFYSAVHLANYERDQPQRAQFLDAIAVEMFKQTLGDASLRPEDQPLMAERLLNGWAAGLFSRNEQRIVKITDDAGPSFQWMALVLEGEYEKDQAWRARGSGWANTVTSTGWQGFSADLAQARTSLSNAWNLHPEWPQAAGIMVTVAMGDSGGEEARQWFDRATSARLDYYPAWHNMRWALRPRWAGSIAAMRDFGIAAINTGRFDTDVPRQFFDTVSDLEAEQNTPAGSHLYAQYDIWPQMRRMYEGYIRAGARTSEDRRWRGAYAIVAFSAGHYDVAREQLEKLDWQIPSPQLEGWSADLSLLPDEVAARTGSQGRQIAEAEEARSGHRLDDSLALYRRLSTETNDARTQQFIRYRLASLPLERQLQSGQWIDFLPADTNDLNWSAPRGQWSLPADGGVEIQSGAEGGLLLSRLRVGADFELKGDFEVVRSSTPDFQAGIAMGLPELEYNNWYAFRMKRNTNEDEVVAFSKGWTVSGIIRPCALDGARNSFDFQLRNGKATADVNGRRIISNGQRPDSIWVADNQYLLGLGAFNDVNETVIRYRNIKVRRLLPH